MLTVGKVNRPLALIATVALLAAPSALADLSDVVLTVGANTGRAEGILQLTQNNSYGYWEGNTYRLEIADELNIETAGGDIVATFGPASLISYTDPSRGILAQVNLAFAVQANQASDTDFTITSALLDNLSIASPAARASASFTLTDASPGGAVLTGLHGDGSSYLTQFNGFVPGGTTFTSMIPQMNAPSGSVFAAENFPLAGFTPVGVPLVTDMSSEVKFNLSAGDIASGTTNYLMIPEPASLLLLSVVGLLRRR
jgi:hypothetical protein